MQDKHPESNVTNNDSRTLAPASNKSESFKGNFGSIQMEISRLEEDLKYMTGKGDKQEALGKILRLKKEATESEEGQMTEVENEKNFESGMSFNSYQKDIITGLRFLMDKEDTKNTLKSVGVNILDLNTEVYKSDLEVKKAIDAFIADYRSKRNNFSEGGYNANYTELDRVILKYEKTFGIDNGSLVDMDLKRKKDQSRSYLSLNQSMRELDSLKQRLLEAKAGVKTTILGGRDESEVLRVESAIAIKKRDIALIVSRSVGEYLGINLNIFDFVDK